MVNLDLGRLVDWVAGWVACLEEILMLPLSRVFFGQGFPRAGMI